MGNYFFNNGFSLLPNHGIDTFMFQNEEWENFPTLSFFSSFMDKTFPEARDEKIKVDKLYEKYKGESSRTTRKDVPTSNVKTKKIKEYINERIASITEFFLSNDNLFHVRNDYDGGSDSLSMLHGAILNEQFNNPHEYIDKVNIIREIVSRCTKEGTCIIKIEWKTDSIIEYSRVPLEDFVEEDNIPEGISLKKQYVENERIVRDTPVISFIEIDDFYFYENIVSDDIIGRRFLITLEDFLNDKRYFNKDIIKKNIKTLSESNKYQQDDELLMEFYVYEFYLKYDVKNNGHKEEIIVSIVADTFVRMSKNVLEQRPFILMKYDFDHKNKYGMSDIELLESNQAIFDALVRGMLDTIARNSAGQRGVVDGFLDDKNRKRFERGLDYTYRRGLDPRESIFIHEYPPLTETPFQIMNFFDQNAQNLTGIRPLHNTMAESSATSARGVLDAISVRESYILSDIKNGIKKMGYIIAKLNSYVLSDEKLEEFIGKELIPQFRESESYKNIDIEVLTLSYRNMLLQNLSFLYQTTAQSASAEERKLLQAEIAMLSNRPRLANMLLNVQPTQQEIELQQLEIDMRKAELEKLHAEIANIKARAGENEIDQRLKTAKAINEETKAKLNVSQADKLDSEFIKNMRENNFSKDNKKK